MPTRRRRALKLGVAVEDLQDTRGNHGNHARGSAHYRWNAARIKSSHGYVKIRVGPTHPLADPNGYAYEHWIVWYSSGRSALPFGFVIHHKNGDQTDNRIENLEMMTGAEHNRLHNIGRVRDTKGRFVGKKAAGSELDGEEHKEVPG